MARLGFIVPPVPGHMLPSLALAAAFRDAGHSVRYYHIGDIQEQIEGQGHSFTVLGADRFPIGYLPKMRRRVAEMRGLRAIRASVAAFGEISDLFCDELAEALTSEPVDYLVVDQIEPLAGLLARALEIPYASVAYALPMDPDPALPPSTSTRQPGGRLSELRNRLCYAALRIPFVPTYRRLRRASVRYGVPYDWSLFPYLSDTLQCNQLIEAFDFPRKQRPAVLHYLGSMRRRSASDVAFPYDWLDGRPLVYASLGTTVCRHLPLLRRIADAAAGEPYQMVLALGGQTEAAELGQLTENVLAVRFAPQPELIARAALVVTHAGLNTTMESIEHGVPMVAIPLSYEQPGIAARIERSQLGVRCRFRDEVAHLRQAIRQVLGDASYRHAAARMQQANKTAGGPARAVHLVEQALG